MADTDNTETEEDLEESKAPLLEHLIELRRRLVYSFASVIILFFACYYFAPDIYNFLVHPLADAMDGLGGNRRLIFTAAPPGQGGHGHCNLQPFKFWSDRLAERGVVFNPQDTAWVKRAWERILGEHLPWLYHNIALFERK